MRSSSVVPARQGAHQPHDSSTKNSVKSRTACSRSRSLPNTMTEPPVARSSKQSLRPKSLGATQAPDGPPTCTACTSSAPTISSSLLTLVPELQLVDAGRRAVAGDAEELGARRVPGADPGEPAGPLFQHPRRAAERLGVVDGRGLAQVALGHGERRAVARGAALALRGLQQRRLLAADVRARAHLDADVEVEAFLAADVIAQQTLVPAPREDLLDALLEKGVLAAQVQEAEARADCVGGDRHALRSRGRATG